ncbi:hypothetical protein [Nakamurella lactea]|uniref:hypothetical protein n=1 Tax=Nakamurella lactea TaxID=459515 RepID=UPI00040A9ACB|nr:hypothetical protein [Nakamurella lactea]
MGCDIHLYTEVQSDDGTWRTTTEPVVADAGTEDEYTSLEATFRGRNYDLFAILAGVRNGRGFAGTDLGDPTVPISEPRGIADDASEQYRAESDRWGVDGHSHSYFTLTELLRHTWTESTTTHRMWVRRKKTASAMSQYLLSQGLDDPDKFAARMQEIFQSTGEDGYRYLENWEAEGCGRSSEGQGASGWRTIQWTTNHLESAGSSWSKFLVSLCSLAATYGLTNDQVRISFFFDN